MHAIIETGGKQYKVAEGDTLFIEKLPGGRRRRDLRQGPGRPGRRQATFGTPVVEGAKVDASVVKNGKGKKVSIFKYKPKKGYRRKPGPSSALHQGDHRQDLRLMTTVSFRTEGAASPAFTVQGHSGYAEAGSDIVCAAVTSAVRLAECAVNDVLGLGAAVKVRGKGRVHLLSKLPGGLGRPTRATCQTLC